MEKKFKWTGNEWNFLAFIAIKNSMLSQHPLTVAISPVLLMEWLFKNTHKRTHKKGLVLDWKQEWERCIWASGGNFKTIAPLFILLLQTASLHQKDTGSCFHNRLRRYINKRCSCVPPVGRRRVSIWNREAIRLWRQKESVNPSPTSCVALKQSNVPQRKWVSLNAKQNKASSPPNLILYTQSPESRTSIHPATGRQLIRLSSFPSLSLYISIHRINPVKRSGEIMCK